MIRRPRVRRRTVVITIVALTAAGTAISLDPGDRRLIVQLASCAVGGLATVSLLRALRRAAPAAPRSPLDRPRVRQTRVATPPIDLVRITRRLAAASASAADARRHLGPVVAAVVADRIGRHGHDAVDPDSVFAQLPRPVAPELALLLDPALDRPDQRDPRTLPGLDAAGALALVRALEQL